MVPVPVPVPVPQVPHFFGPLVPVLVPQKKCGTGTRTSMKNSAV